MGKQAKQSPSGVKLGFNAKAFAADQGPAANEVIAPGGSAVLANPMASFSSRLKEGDAFQISGTVSGLVIAAGGSALVELLETVDGGTPTVIRSRTVTAKTDPLDAASSVPVSATRTLAADATSVKYQYRISAVAAQVTAPGDGSTLEATHY